MEKNPFAEQVRRHCRFLFEENGFSVVHERHFPDVMGNSDVLLRSEKVGMQFALDRGEASVRLGPLSTPADSWFDLSVVVRYLNPKSVEPVYVRPDGWDDYDLMVEQQVAQIASILKRFCVPVLRGLFRDWEELDNYRHTQAEIEYRRLTGKPLPRRTT